MRRSTIAACAAAAALGVVALSGSAASAFTSRDCKLYDHCDYNTPSYQGYVNTYGGYNAPQPAPVAPATDGQMRPETGIVGPHGVGWY